MLKKGKKEKIIKQYKIHESDTGSPEVQVAVLTKKINELTSHLKTHRKDNHSRRGLLGMVSRRRKTLQYLRKQNIKRYEKLVKSLSLKK